MDVPPPPFRPEPPSHLPPPPTTSSHSSEVHFALADFTDPGLGAFLQAHLDDLAPTAPAESRHALDLSGLDRPQVRLWVARAGNSVVATGALAHLKASDAASEDLKSMRTDPTVRGTGLGRVMLRHLMADARARGVERLSLETGSMEFFVAARTLYASEGFVECEPFGDYVEDPHSVFMTVSL